MNDDMTARMREFQSIDEETSMIMHKVISDFSAALGNTVLSATQNIRDVANGNIELHQRQLADERRSHQTATEQLIAEHKKQSEDSAATTYALEQEKQALENYVSDLEKTCEKHQQTIVDLKKQLLQAEANKEAFDALIARLGIVDEPKSATKPTRNRSKTVTAEK